MSGHSREIASAVARSERCRFLLWGPVSAENTFVHCLVIILVLKTHTYNMFISQPTYFIFKTVSYFFFKAKEGKSWNHLVIPTSKSKTDAEGKYVNESAVKR